MKNSDSTKDAFPGNSSKRRSYISLLLERRRQDYSSHIWSISIPASEKTKHNKEAPPTRVKITIHSVTIKFPKWGHKIPYKNDKKKILIASLNRVPTRFRTTFTSLIQRIECPRKRFFPYRLRFSRHSLLDRCNSRESRSLHRIV
jgi:hypothetical protein